MEEIALNIELEKVTKIYDYYDHVESDVLDLIAEREEDKSFCLSWYLHDREDGKGKWFNVSECCKDLENLCWDNDSVTGNGSGSYTFDTVQAERNLVGNWGLLKEALVYMGQTDVDILDKGAEWCDVLIRCHILENVIINVLTDYDIKHCDNEDADQEIDPDDLPM